MKDIVDKMNEYFEALREITLFLRGDLIFFCAWWPWGNGAAISIRFAPHIKSLSDKEMVKIMGQFRSTFNLT